MVVNGFELPVAFVELCEAVERGEAPKEWALKTNVDAYGRPWVLADLRILERDQEALQLSTDWIAEFFAQSPEDADEPGFIADFTGVDNFVWLGSTTDGMIHAFDFGTDPKEPSVVYWMQYWRRVAPNFVAFMALFIDTSCVSWDGERGEMVLRPPQDVLTRQALWYVLARRESVRRLFEDVGKYYASCSKEERLEAEARVREYVGGMGMTDDQQQRFDELWERLRTSHPS